jgi:hypothetical protein
MSDVTEHLRPEDRDALSQEEFARTAGLPQQQVRELLDYGLLAAAKLDLRTALALREAVRLKGDFDLDLFATGLLAGYIEEIRELRSDLARARAEHPVRSVVTEVSFTSVQVTRRP